LFPKQPSLKQRPTTILPAICTTLAESKQSNLIIQKATSFLLQALRKAPQVTAKGFRLTVHKLSCIVQLLLGEIPERSIFTQPRFAKRLRGYFEITQAVRIGDLSAFKDVMDRYGNQFNADKTYNLILRLRHNVIKTGLRKISVSYSRISFADICAKLQLDSVEDAEGIVSKAIRDGVIDAVIDHQSASISSKEIVDIYSTQEPQSAFHRRITFCLNVHNDAVKAMRFPPDSHKKDAAAAEARKEREKQEAEIVESLAEEDDEDF